LPGTVAGEALAIAKNLVPLYSIGCGDALRFSSHSAK
jgi:hypothetical protein